MLSRSLSLRLLLCGTSSQHSLLSVLPGTFNPRVSEDVDRQSLDVRKDGQGMGPQATGFRCRQRCFFEQHGDGSPHRTTQRHGAKNTSATRHLPLLGTVHRHRQHQRHRQHLPSRSELSRILKWAPGPISASKKSHTQKKKKPPPG